MNIVCIKTTFYVFSENGKSFAFPRGKELKKWFKY